MGEDMIDLEAQEKAMWEEAAAILPPGLKINIGYSFNGSIWFGADKTLSDKEDAGIRKIIHKYSLKGDFKIPEQWRARERIMFGDLSWQGFDPKPDPAFPQPWFLSEGGGLYTTISVPNPEGNE